MTQIYDEQGHAQPVTVLEAGPCTVTQVLTDEANGYSAAQVGFGSKKLNKPELGHVKEFAEKNVSFALLREFPIEEGASFAKGEQLDVTQFEVGDIVAIRGTSKAKGFQGVVKRHGFKGGPGSHGMKHSLRAPGSIGSAYPQRVMKGKRMAGRMGGVTHTTIGLRVVEVVPAKNLLVVRGAVPGNTGSYVEIQARPVRGNEGAQGVPASNGASA